MDNKEKNLLIIGRHPSNSRKEYEILIEKLERNSEFKTCKQNID